MQHIRSGSNIEHPLLAVVIRLQVLVSVQAHRIFEFMPTVVYCETGTFTRATSPLTRSQLSIHAQSYQSHALACPSWLGYPIWWSQAGLL